MPAKIYCVQSDTNSDFRPRHSAWKNSCDSLTFEELHENWTLVLRFQVFRRRRISSKKARAGLKPYMKLNGMTNED